MGARLMPSSPRVIAASLLIADAEVKPSPGSEADVEADTPLPADMRSHWTPTIWPGHLMVDLFTPRQLVLSRPSPIWCRKRVNS